MRETKHKSLLRQTLTRFTACVAALLLLATPLFYSLTKNFYAEDLRDVVEAARQDKPVPSIDLEEDVAQGIMIQFAIIAAVLGTAIVLTMRLIAKRLWRPFESTLSAIEAFRVENGTATALPDCETAEFARLNAALNKLMTDSTASYRTQREFTENASHELQTPLAVLKTKLEMLAQQPGLTESQAAIIQDLDQTCGRLSRLNRNLLLLAKLDNKQFGKEDLDVESVADDLWPYFGTIAGELTLRRTASGEPLKAKANRALLECMMSNLLVNAVRHNRPGGMISVATDGESLTVANTSDEPKLDTSLIFNRFYRPTEKTAGSGLGLAIVRAVCDYHGWQIGYAYRQGTHEFRVTFGDNGGDTPS